MEGMKKEVSNDKKEWKGKFQVVKDELKDTKNEMAAFKKEFAKLVGKVDKRAGN